MSFGHAGTIVEGAEDSATEKIARLEAAGIPVVERIDEIPDRVKEALGPMSEEPDTASSSTSRSTTRSPATPSWRQARGGLPGRHLQRRATAASRSSRENLDECVLCELCLDAAPAGTVVVKKLYDGTELRR